MGIAPGGMKFDIVTQWANLKFNNENMPGQCILIGDSIRLGYQEMV